MAGRWRDVGRQERVEEARERGEDEDEVEVQGNT